MHIVIDYSRPIPAIAKEFEEYINFIANVVATNKFGQFNFLHFTLFIVDCAANRR